MARGTILPRFTSTGERRFDAEIRVEGKKISKTFKKKGDAEAWLDRNSTDIREQTYRELIPASFKEYTKRWRANNLTTEQLKPSTLSVYNYLLDKHLIPAFSTDLGVSLPIAGIRTKHITDLTARLLKEQSSASVKKILNLLGMVFDDAVEEEYLRVSPMPKPKKNRRKKGNKSSKAARRGRALTPDQAQRLLVECEGNDDLRLVILIGLLAGLRRGEIVALQWPDIDFDKDIIHVSRSLFWAYGKHHERADDERVKVVIDTPKTATSVRGVDLSPTLKSELRTRYLKAKDKRGLIFQSREGTPLDPGNVVSRWFHPAVENAIEKAEKQKDHAAVKALTGLHFHDLRHTFGSWLVASGQDILYVSAQMGHARPSITADVYSHLLTARRPHAAQAMDDMLFGQAVTAK